MGGIVFGRQARQMTLQFAVERDAVIDDNAPDELSIANRAHGLQKVGVTTDARDWEARAQVVEELSGSFIVGGNTCRAVEQYRGIGKRV
jgi:hypothetical protein